MSAETTILQIYEPGRGADALPCQTLRKIFQGSDGTVRVIDGLRALDDMYGYLRRATGCSMRYWNILLEYDPRGAVTFRVPRSAIWCTIYPVDHPDAPPILRSSEAK